MPPGGSAFLDVPLLRGAASVVAGFLLLPILMQVALIALSAVSPDVLEPERSSETLTGSFMWVNLGLTGLMAALSAVVTAILAPEPRFLWVLLLGFLVFAGGLVFGIQQSGGIMPTWYLLAMPLMSGLSIAGGGYTYLAWRDRRT